MIEDEIYSPMVDTMSIVKPQKYMKPQTSNNVRITHNKIQQQVCISTMNSAVVAITQISASTRFRISSWAINLSVIQVANGLLHTVTYP